MASYKVPQDVEADDKLIGPFSFRQFIYIIVACLAIAAAWGLAQIFIGLVILPLPIILLFGALALPLRKDQPMEIYLVAMVRFFLKPRVRLWQPEGQVNLVTIIAPHQKDEGFTPRISGREAQQRLSYLAQVIDTQGWAARGVTSTSMSSLNDTITAEASMVDDIMDSSVGIGRQFDSLIEQQDHLRKQHMTDQVQGALHPALAPAIQQFQPFPAQQQVISTQPAPLAQAPISQTPPPVPTIATAPTPTFNPYPSSMHQHVVDPSGPAPTVPSAPQVQPPVLPILPAPIVPSDMGPSPDIMRLANNKDLSISAIAREAHRLEDDDEVVVSLR